MIKPVIIFGAGKKGLKLLEKLNRNTVAFFADNDKMIVGGIIEGIEIISFEKLLEIYEAYDVILSFDSKEIMDQLGNSNIPYWGNENNKNSYFNRKEIREEIDKKLLWRYWKDTELKDRVYMTEGGNWYRKEYCSNENRMLVEMMEKNQTDKISKFLENFYGSAVIYEDEYYMNRPGMRLVRNILISEKNFKKSVLDLGCGHGELLLTLKKDGFMTYGIDQSIDRVKYLQEKGIDCICTNVEADFRCDRKFDVIVCQECLEHVTNPVKVLKRVKTLLNYEGKVSITVPYGKNCDSVTHVRQFDENKLYSLLVETGFKIMNIIKIPYLNYSNDVNLFVEAKNIENYKRDEAKDI